MWGSGGCAPTFFVIFHANQYNWCSLASFLMELWEKKILSPHTWFFYGIGDDRPPRLPGSNASACNTEYSLLSDISLVLLRIIIHLSWNCAHQSAKCNNWRHVMFITYSVSLSLLYEYRLHVYLVVLWWNFVVTTASLSYHWKNELWTLKTK